MALSDLVISAVTIFFSTMFLIVGISYLAYKLKKKSRYYI